VAIQAQIQVLLAEGAETTGERREVEAGAGNIEVVKLQLFDRTPSRVAGVMGHFEY